MGEPNRARRPATYDDLLKVPDHLVAEILDGELYTSPRPAPQHTGASSGLGGALHGPFDRGRGGPGGWRILDEPELHLGHDVVVPDLGGWRRERLPRLPQDAFFALAPDWVCEVLSPATRTYDLTEKRDIYAEHGVAHLWLIDPQARTLEAFRLADGAWTLIAALHDEAEVRLPPYEAIAVPLAALWAD
jgi:Uma2 family endonuclease